MKQKNIIINGQFSLDAENLIREYFAIKTVNKIEGFLVSSEDFINRHQNTYAYHELRSTNYYAIYTIDSCGICLNPYDVIIDDRSHLYDYLMTTYKLCRGCKRFHASLRFNEFLE